MKCIFCKTEQDVKNIRPGTYTEDMEGICMSCLNGLKVWLNKKPIKINYGKHKIQTLG